MTPLLFVGGILGLVYYVNIKTNKSTPVEPAPEDAPATPEPNSHVPYNKLPPRTQGAAMGMMENYGKDKLVQIDGVPVGGAPGNVINDPHVPSINLMKKESTILRPVNVNAL